MPFETFTKRRTPLMRDPTVTIQKKGVFSLNEASYEALESPVAVELLWDANEKLLGLRKVEPESDHAYPVRGMGRRGSTYLISGTAFTVYYGIQTEVARRRRAEVRDGILVIDLKEPGLEVFSNRLSRPTNDQETATDDLEAARDPFQFQDSPGGASLQ